jgi:hypothetical protein
MRTPMKSWITLLRRGLCGCLLLSGPGAAQTFFTEVAAEAIAGRQTRARSIAFGDIDNDGYPDLFLAEDRQPVTRVVLYHNEGNGRFTDQTTAIQEELTPKWKGGGSVFGDYDNDGDLDLYVPVGAYASDQAEQNILLRNDGGGFRDVALEAGLTDSLPTDNALWLDYDRDGHLDIYTGNTACEPADTTVRNRLYRNNGDGTFRDATAAAGLDFLLKSPTPSLPCGGGSNGGMAAGDFNGDGWPDLYMGVFDGRNRLFLSDGKGGLRDATTSEIGDPGNAFGVAVGDIDNDGDLDLFQASGGGGVCTAP